MKNTKYTSWPIGKVPKELQRPELDQLRKAGYEWEDPRDAIYMFEEKVAEYAGSKYAISVDCCSNGLFLCLKYLNAEGTITIPSRTYASVPMQIIHAGCKVRFDDFEWSGIYQLKPYPIIDGAVRFTKGMYVPNTLHVLSFQLKKRLPIGKGGMILTDDEEAANWLRKASYDGRDIRNPYDKDQFSTIGYHMYMTPEDAARGILLMDKIPVENEDTQNSRLYTDLSTQPIFKDFIDSD